MHSAALAPGMVRYHDRGSYLWLWKHAPCAWKHNVEFCFAEVPFQQLQPAASLIDPAVVESQIRRMRQGRTLAPLVVSETASGALYVHDGNHRYRALLAFHNGDEDVRIRVAVAVPRPGYEFRYRWFGDYGTYLLELATPLLSDATALPFTGRTMVLVAHPDDETGGCAGLLQRMQDAVLVFATDGAPDDPYFWGRYGSPAGYTRARRQEARRALAAAEVRNCEFLAEETDTAGDFHDQQLHRALPQALEAVSEIVCRYQPDNLLVPAYEGGHPDHDSCSFLGAMLGRRFGLPVWEMPLYHRSPSGRLVCRHFRGTNGSERLLVLTPEERRTRTAMVASYASQTDLADFVGAPVERYRPQAEYDFSRPPHPGTLNYQAWQWPISPQEVCRAFQKCAQAVGKLAAGHASTVGTAAMVTHAVAAAAGAL